jgi:cell division protein FtsL
VISLGNPMRRGASNRWQSDIKARRQRHARLRSTLPRALRRITEASRRVAEDLDKGSFSFFGFETSRLRVRLPTSILLWGALALVASNLSLVALRSDVTRVRYELSQASAELRRLDEESRGLTLKLGELKSPRRLAEIARSRGFAPPERIVELP